MLKVTIVSAILSLLMLHYLYLRFKHINVFRKTRSLCNAIDKLHIMDEEDKTAKFLENQIKGWRKSVQQMYLQRFGDIIQIVKNEWKKSMHILDSGCGDCYLSAKMVNRMGVNEINLYGFDLSRKRLSLARQRLNNIHLVQGDVEDLSFRNSQFNIVICSETLEHLINPSKAIDEMKRVLKIGGLLILTVPSKHVAFISYFNPLTWLEAIISIRFPSILPPFHNLYRPHDENTVIHRAFTFSETKDLLKSWDYVKMESFNYLLEVLIPSPKLANKVRKLFRKVPGLNKLGLRLIVRARAKKCEEETNFSEKEELKYE